MTTADSRLATPWRDRTIDLTRHGYGFAARQRVRRPPGTDADAVPLRLAGEEALLLRGPEGVRLFCDTDLVRRDGATPGLVAGPLFGRGAVHGLDDEDHRARKALFVDATAAPRVQDLVADVALRWERQGHAWTPGSQVVVEDEAVRVFGRSVLAWAGVSLEAREADTVSGWLATIVDGFAVPGRPYLKSLRARRRSDAWTAEVIADVRAGRLVVDEDTVVAAVSRWTGADGHLLEIPVAAVELPNVLRPTGAVSRFAGFAALALAQHGEWRERLRQEVADTESARLRPGPCALAFAQEVRRLTPFVPMLAALTRHDLRHRGVWVRGGTRLLLDVVGTNRDDRYWSHPTVFDPGRFLPGETWESDALVPQGGGNVATGHRCPGEDVTLGLIAVTASYLAARGWWARDRDVQVPSRRMPTRPTRGMRIVVDDEVPAPGFGARSTG